MEPVTSQPKYASGFGMEPLDGGLNLPQLSMLNNLSEVKVKQRFTGCLESKF